MKMPRVIALALSLSTACATVPPEYPYDPAMQRAKEGSLNHAYGAALVLSGTTLLLGGAGIMTMGAGNRGLRGDDKTPFLAAGGGALGVGLLFAVLGGVLVSAGNNAFTPPPEVGSTRTTTVAYW